MLKKNRKQRMIPFLLGLLLLLQMTPFVCALDDDAYDGYEADTLTIEVGYFGGPYYEKKVFTPEELGNMPLVREDYTFIDNLPSVVIDHVVGVRLDDLMAEAGIDVNSIETFRFWTVDKTSDYYTQYPKNELLDTTRYCYYSLPDNFDSENGVGLEGADAVGVPVPTVMALADDWNRCIQGAEFGSDYENLNTATRFRLIFGQVDTTTRTAQRSAKWVHKIEVTLGGAPTITVDTADLEMEVGSVRRVQAQIHAADSLIAAGASVAWSSSDESVATVDQEGNVTIVGEGTAVITVTSGSASASFTVRGTGEKEEEEKKEEEKTEPTPEPEEPSEAPAVEDPPAEEAPVEEVTSDEVTEAVTIVPGTVGSVRRGSSDSAGNAESSGSPPSADSDVTQPQPEPEPEQPEETEPVPEEVQAQEVTLDGSTPLEIQDLEAPEAGGVQNWRVFEMSEAAQELPEIEMDNPLLGFTGAASGIVFMAGGVTEYVLFRRRMEP